MSSEDLPKLPESSRTYRIVTVGFGFLLIVLLIAFIIQKSREIHTIVRPIQQYSESLARHGMRSEPPERDTSAIASSFGQVYKIEVDGKPIWLMYFDPEDKIQADAMAALKNHPTVKLGGEERAVKFHGSLALIGYDNHPDQAKLLEALDDFDVPGKQPEK
ncbi:MAG TPA: hypothetical protein VKB78_05965 [Pirellulales bacterium]|nr:hypothetical protein [Pirellulales bacterium]